MPPFTQDQLREAAKHLGYEWAMLLGARHTDWHKLQTSDPLQGRANQHARVEVMLLHTRVIYEFLFGTRTPQHPDDVRAADYLPGTLKSDWERDRASLRKTLCPSIERDMDRLNKRLFHLSYERIDLPTGWDPDVAIKELKAAFRHYWGLFTEHHTQLVMIHEGLLCHLIDPVEVFGI